VKSFESRSVGRFDLGRFVGGDAAAAARGAC